MFTLPELPFAQNALEPHLSAETLETHHGKHHKKYVDTLNELVKGTAYDDMSLEQIIVEASTSDDKKIQKIFNNAAQHWNHSFLWCSFTPDYARPSDNPALAAVEKSFGSFENFRDAFIKEGLGHFGSGWVWLVAENGKLEVLSTHDADLPLAHHQHAILTCDLWEHAYYLDFKSDREAFLNTFVDKLANWHFASANFAKI